MSGDGYCCRKTPKLMRVYSAVLLAVLENER